MSTQTFATPEPILATVTLTLGDLRVVAENRSDTLVDVRPTDPDRVLDVQDARQTVVEHADGRLLVKTPRRVSLFGKGGSVAVTLHLPAGSSLIATAALGDVRATGPLGDCRVKTAMGEIWLDFGRDVNLATDMGDVTVERIDGPAEVSTGSGAVRLGEIAGPAVVKTSNGSTWIGRAGADLQVKASNGAIAVDRADAGVRASSANGAIRVGAVSRGSLDLHTAVGAIDVGVTDGTAAWLDVSTKFGTVRTTLESAGDPGPGHEAVEIHARTSFGDISVHRA